MSISIRDNGDGTATIVAQHEAGRYVYDKDVPNEQLDDEAEFLSVVIEGGLHE